MTELPPPTEAAESRVLMQYMRLRNIMFTHVKNETGRSARGQKVRNWKAVWDFADGVRPGFPDFIIVLPGRVIAIELKRLKGSKTSPHQIGWLEALNDAGMPAFICKGSDEAIKVIEDLYPQRSAVGRPRLVGDEVF